MSTTNLGSTVTRTLAVPVLLLIALAVALAAWIAHLTRAEVWVQHSYEVMATVNQAEKLLIDQETGLRGYLLSSDRRFLQPYESGQAGFAKSLEQLSRLTGDNPSQGRRIAATRETYRQWLAYAEAERARIPPEQSALFVSRMAARKQEMDRLRASFSELSGEENRLLTERAELARRANRALLYAGAGLLIFCSIVVVLFLRRQLREIDRIYLARVDESERARRAAEEMAAEIREQAAAMEASVRAAYRERDDAVRELGYTRES
ncbi:MAG TPA: CHASE3 domain-containing protein [Thermoanaerobaculia bacterium]|jgi:CHASE3 domain sensor protein|nr:CHASE3 domain-containing protein [Thermoanaerobaculia bacterium]